MIGYLSLQICSWVTGSSRTYIYDIAELSASQGSIYSIKTSQFIFYIIFDGNFIISFPTFTLFIYVAMEKYSCKFINAFTENGMDV